MIYATTARYSKGNIAVSCPSDDTFIKSRGARLAVYLKGRWSRREKAYIMSPQKAAKLQELYNAGYDACTMTNELFHPTTDS